MVCSLSVIWFNSLFILWSHYIAICIYYMYVKTEVVFEHHWSLCCSSVYWEKETNISKSGLACYNTIITRILKRLLLILLCPRSNDERDLVLDLYICRSVCPSISSQTLAFPVTFYLYSVHISYAYTLD